LGVSPDVEGVHLPPGNCGGSSSVLRKWPGLENQTGP
jgi:hypothetical protein